MATKEAIRAYWNTLPCGFTHTRAAEGTQEFYDQIEHRRYFVEDHIPAVAEFDEHAGEKVLEIGCGLGTDLLQFARGGAEVTGLDLTPRGIELTRKRFDVYGLSGTFIVHDAESLPFEDASFDLVYSFGVIHHTPNTRQVVDEIYRVLKPGGKAIVMIYHRRSFKYMVDILLGHGVLGGQLLRKSSAELLNRFTEAQENSPLTKVYTPSEAKAMFGAFRQVETSIHYIYKYRPEPYKRGEFKKRFLFGVLPSVCFKALARKFGWHLVIKATK
jgi:ubiquinone/menaquinone biosynthesis C-methylase UbiE